uniref:Uncharacterized protein n=1 Tax=Solibacter usitatus (strain Ellin6076) TaxID=234267 RepID=Q02CC9_SOLUE
MRSPIVFLMLAGVCAAQTTVNGGRDYKGTLSVSGTVSAVDFSGAGVTAPVKTGLLGVRPVACTRGQIYFATDAAAGQNLFFCTATGSPGTWSQMSGSGGGSGATIGNGAPVGNCSPPALYIDTTNQDLWFCGATNSWKKPAPDMSSVPTLSGGNTWTGYNNQSAAQWRPPESTVANLPAAAANTGKVFMVIDAQNAGTCSAGGGSVRELCRANGAAYECVGGCGASGTVGGGGGAGGGPPYITSLIAGPDTVKTIPGAIHGFATTGLLVAVYDNATPRNAIAAHWTVDASTYDVAISFATPQSNYYVVVNGGSGPAGSNGATGAGYAATSSTSVAIGTGSKSFTTQAGLAYSAGARVRASSTASPTNYMEGMVTAYSGTTLTINSINTGGSGSYSSWNLNVSGDIGPQGPTGASGSGSGNVNTQGTPETNRIATFYDGTGNLITDGIQHSLGSGYLSGTKTAGAAGTMANTLCKIDTTGNVVTAASGDMGILGICMTTQISGQSVEVAMRGIVSCLADNNTTAGNLAVAGTGTGGYCRDSGQANATGISMSKQVIGKILTAVTAGGGQMVSIQLYGPGHYGAQVAASDLPANGVDSTKLNVVNTRRTCMIVIGADNGPALATADIAPQARQCFIPAAAHVVEITVSADGGTPAVTAAKNHGGVLTDLSASLATGASGAPACANSSGSGLGLDGSTTCASQVTTAALAAGDWIETHTSATASTAKRMSIAVTYTVD